MPDMTQTNQPETFAEPPACPDGYRCAILWAWALVLPSIGLHIIRLLLVPSDLLWYVGTGFGVVSAAIGARAFLLWKNYRRARHAAEPAG